MTLRPQQTRQATLGRKSDGWQTGWLIGVIMLPCLALIGCDDERNVSLEREELVGTYRIEASSPQDPTLKGTLEIRADGRYRQTVWVGFDDEPVCSGEWERWRLAAS